MRRNIWWLILVVCMSYAWLLVGSGGCMPTDRESIVEQIADSGAINDAKQDSNAVETQPQREVPTETPRESKPDEPTETPCQKAGGYCLSERNKACKDGFEALNNPLGCPTPSPTCCIKSSTPQCQGEGAKVKKDDTCCTGLRKGIATPAPDCKDDGKSYVCVKCGDGICDADKGETACSCAQDCKPAPCKGAGGSCIAKDTNCLPGQTKDAALACEDETQICCIKTNNTSECNTNCDCSQGLLCIEQNGKKSCLSATKPAYCCDRPGCPPGETCTSSDGRKSTCPPENDCTKSMGYCTAQLQKCRPGFLLATNVSCGGDLSKQCCIPDKSKCAGISCGPPTCQQRGNDCLEQKQECERSTGLCAGSGRLLPNHTCNNQAKCVPNPTCASHCDCPQGLVCANGCRAGTAPVYCCNNAQCPTGKACTFRNGNKGTCP